jgi:hypothetical protein
VRGGINTLSKPTNNREPRSAHSLGKTFGISNTLGGGLTAADNRQPRPLVKAGEAALGPDAKEHANRWMALAKGRRIVAILGSTRKEIQGLEVLVHLEHLTGSWGLRR